jgi:hypothetical protein
MHALAFRNEWIHSQIALPPLPSAALASGISALQECQSACESAGDDTVGSYGLIACIELLEDCQARCSAAEHMLHACIHDQLALLRSQLSECAEICDRCARACLQHHDFENWSLCADAGRACAGTCRYLLLLLPSSIASRV